MSFLFVDGFDHYGSASILDKWTATVGGGVAAVASWCEAERARSAAWLAQRLRGGRP